MTSNDLRNEERPHGAGPLRVLVVDDDPDATDLLSLGLGRRGFEVAIAASCAEARSRLEAARVDVLVADIHLPDGDGYEVVQAARSLQATRCIALTGFGRAEDVRRSHEAGFDVHLTKPVRIADLVAAIEQLAGAPPAAPKA